jgi:hypothetical protein
MHLRSLPFDRHGLEMCVIRAATIWNWSMDGAIDKRRPQLTIDYTIAPAFYPPWQPASDVKPMTGYPFPCQRSRIVIR